MKLIDVKRLVRKVINEDKYHPPGHMLGMHVPKGGSCCANCTWLDKDQKHCGNKFYQAWNNEVVRAPESSKIPNHADQYCCDLYTAG